mmetsp:Transcript_62282/g.115592  ORF Transcript_62282/g.115592 Transcript_62282/m.115592 type:complete len:510 (-) Transcript_62282:119-1648(-)
MVGQAQDVTAGSPRQLLSLSRMLRIEHKGQAYDWFNLDELSDVVRMNDFANTLRENVAHYFGVPTEWQAIYDEEGLLITGVDFSRALQSVRPWLRVYDIREMMPDFREQTALKLATVSSEVTRMQRNLRSQSSTAPTTAVNGHLAAVGIPSSVERLSHTNIACNDTTVVHQVPASPLPTGRNTWHLGNSPQPNVVATTTMQPLSPRPGTSANLPPAASAGYSPQGSFLLPQAPPPPINYLQVSPARSGTPPPPVPPRCNSAPPGSEPQVLTMPQLTPPAALPPPVLPAMRPPHLQPPMTMGAPAPPGAAPAGPPGAPPMQRAPFGQPMVLPPPCGGSALLPPGGACPGPTTPPMPGPWATPPPGAPMPPPPFGAPCPGGCQVVREPVVAGPGMHMNGYMRPAMLPQDRTGIVEVLLTKDAGVRDGSQRFGFANILTQDGRGLVVSWVDEHGLLSRWNHQHPDKAVLEGDRILAVNSAHDDIEAMRAQLQLDSIRMVVQRYGRPALPTAC